MDEQPERAGGPERTCIKWMVGLVFAAMVLHPISAVISALLLMIAIAVGLIGLNAV